MVYSSILQLPLSCRLAVELFIEGKDCSLRGFVDVSCTSAAAGESRVRLRKTGFEERSSSVSCSALAGLGSFEDVSGATTTSVSVFAWVWVWLGDLVLRWHSCGLSVKWRGETYGGKRLGSGVKVKKCVEECRGSFKG